MKYKNHLKSLRKDYIEATPSQRLWIARQRIEDIGPGPNMLVAYVSAIEGFARCLAMHQESAVKKDLSNMYPKYKFLGAIELIDSYLRKKLQQDTKTFLGDELLKKLEFAIEYRNLLAHECTFLGQDIYPDLIDSCRKILFKLAEVEGLEKQLP